MSESVGGERPLLKDLLEREASTTKTFIEVQSTKLKRYIDGRLWSSHDRSIEALDVVQTVWGQFWNGLAKFGGESDDSVVAWLFAIARNVLNDLLRRGRVRMAWTPTLAEQARECVPSSESIAEDLETVEAIGIARQACRLLSTREQGVLLALEEELSTEDIMIFFGFEHASQVHAFVHRTRKKLRAIMARLPDYSIPGRQRRR